jgi:hypothetical protein
MKRVAVLLGIAAAAPSVAFGQVPTAAPSPAPAAAPAAPPGDQYYVEPPRTDAEAAPPPPVEPPPPGTALEPPLPGAAYEPPPPGTAYEPPPPPPEPRHLAPRMSLWAGARVGWFFPFGNLWSDGVPAGSDTARYYVLKGKPWRDYANSGPMFELDLGLRVSRSYTVFALWERAELRAGREQAGLDGAQSGGDSDFVALGLRASSDPDRLGFVTEVAIGFRRARTRFDNGAEYQFTDAPFEARLGLGAEYRVSRELTLSPLLSVGVGGFGTVRRVSPSGSVASLTDSFDEADGHAWVTLSFGGHFDLFGTKK